MTHGLSLPNQRNTAPVLTLSSVCRGELPFPGCSLCGLAALGAWCLNLVLFMGLSLTRLPENALNAVG